MTPFSVAYVALAWVASVFVVVFAAMFWRGTELMAFAALVLAALSFTAGCEVARWWRTSRAIAELYVKAARERAEAKAALWRALEQRPDEPVVFADLERAPEMEVKA